MRTSQPSWTPALKVISLILIPCQLVGCSLFGPRYQTIGVISDPAGAKVNVAGNTVGITPVNFEVHRGTDLILEIRKTGYQTQYRSASRSLGTLGVLDVVGAFFLAGLPLIGLLSPGAWKHDPSNFGITLEPDKIETVPP